MDLGHEICPAPSPEAAAWIEQSCSGPPGTIGALVPNHFEAYLRVHAPEPTSLDWWQEYRNLFGHLAAIGTRHTDEADHAWFATWTGHGYNTESARIAWSAHARDSAEMATRREALRQFQRESVRAYAERESILQKLPTFDRGDRRHYLVQGTVASVTCLQIFSEHRWHNPDLFWPNDRRWFVATDVDFWSLYVGGDTGFIQELTASLPVRSERVELGDPTPPED